MNHNKNILLGVTGSIAAYKAAILIRLLVKEQASVKVIMTPLAKEFISPLTLATLSKNPILTDFFNPENGDWNSHVDLGLWADAFVIAPATANTIAKMAHGIADNLLLTSYLSARCPVFVAPAMDLDMFKHPATQQNLKIIQGYGNHIIEPASGELASGLEGKGRMDEPEHIVAQVMETLNNSNNRPTSKLDKKKILVTSGPTREPIDDVRYITNHSSGKMGQAIANELARRGAKVVFITGTAHNMPNHPNIEITRINTADELNQACLNIYPSCDGAVMAAAVADYKVKHASPGKIKKHVGTWQLEMVENPDIAANLGAIKKDNQFLIGFALEAGEGIKQATEKLAKKNLDFIVLNNMTEPGAGFNVDTNKITIIEKNNKSYNFELKSKPKVATDIIDHIEKIKL